MINLSNIDAFKQSWNQNDVKFEQFFSSNSKTASHSRIARLLECPLAHYMIYEEGMRLLKDVLGINMGKAIHLANEYYHGLPYENSFEDNLKSTLDYFDKIWSMLERANMEVFQSGKSTSKLNKEMAKELLTLYISENNDIRQNNDDYRLIQYIYPGMKEPKSTIEMPFRIPMVNLKTGINIVNNYDLIGVIDLIEFFDNHVEIMDHKCLAMKPKQFLFENDLQLVLYSYAFKFLARHNVFVGLNGEEKVLVGFNWLLKPYKGFGGRKDPTYERKLRKVEVSDDEMYGVLDIIKDAIHNYEYGKPVPHYQEACTYKCDLRVPCVAHRMRKNRVEAFTKEFGFEPTKHRFTNAASDDLELF